MLKQLNLYQERKNPLKLSDFELIKVKRRENALGIGSFATVRLAK